MKRKISKSTTTRSHSADLSADRETTTESENLGNSANQTAQQKSSVHMIRKEDNNCEESHARASSNEEEEEEEDSGTASPPRKKRALNPPAGTDSANGAAGVPTPLPPAPALAPAPHDVDGSSAEHRDAESSDTHMVDDAASHAMTNGASSSKVSRASSNVKAIVESDPLHASKATGVGTTDFMSVHSLPPMFPALASSLFASGATPQQPPPPPHLGSAGGTLSSAELVSFGEPSAGGTATAAAHSMSMFQAADALAAATTLPDLDEIECPPQPQLPFESKESSTDVSASALYPSHHSFEVNMSSNGTAPHLLDTTGHHQHSFEEKEHVNGTLAMPSVSFGADEDTQYTPSTPSAFGNAATSALTPAPLTAPSTASMPKYEAADADALENGADGAGAGAAPSDGAADADAPVPVVLPVNKDQAHVFGVRPNVVRKQNSKVPGNEQSSSSYADDDSIALDPSIDFNIQVGAPLEPGFLQREMSKKMYSAGSSRRKRSRGLQQSNSALYYYRMENMERVADQYPEIDPMDIVNLVEKEWRDLSEEAKAKYFKLAGEDRLRFEQDARHYIPKAEGGLMKRPKRKKHPQAPKHPMSAYLYFVADYRPKIKAAHPEKDFTAVARALGEKWKTITGDELERYHQKAEVDKMRYRQEKMAFMPLVRGLSGITQSLDGTKKKRKHPLAPRHPLSGYLFFVANNRRQFNAKYPDKDFTEIAKILGIHWKRLDEKEKRKYNLLAAADRRRYEEEKERFQPPVDEDTEEFRMPKRALTAYSFWAYDERARLLQENPTIAKKEMTRVLREMWNKLPPVMKLIYQEQAEVDRQRYRQELALLPKHFRVFALSKERRQERLMRVPTEVLDWTVAEVRRFIEAAGLLPEIGERFEALGVTGSDLVQLSKTKLRDRMGILHAEDRSRICRAVSILSL